MSLDPEFDFDHDRDMVKIYAVFAPNKPVVRCLAAWRVVLRMQCGGLRERRLNQL